MNSYESCFQTHAGILFYLNAKLTIAFFNNLILTITHISFHPAESTTGIINMIVICGNEIIIENMANINGRAKSLVKHWWNYVNNIKCFIFTLSEFVKYLKTFQSQIKNVVKRVILMQEIQHQSNVHHVRQHCVKHETNR